MAIGLHPPYAPVALEESSLQVGIASEPAFRERFSAALLGSLRDVSPHAVGYLERLWEAAFEGRIAYV